MPNNTSNWKTFLVTDFVGSIIPFILIVVSLVFFVLNNTLFWRDIYWESFNAFHYENITCQYFRIVNNSRLDAQDVLFKLRVEAPKGVITIDTINSEGTDSNPNEDDENKIFIRTYHPDTEIFDHDCTPNATKHLIEVKPQKPLAGNGHCFGFGLYWKDSKSPDVHLLNRYIPVGEEEGLFVGGNRFENVQERSWLARYDFFQILIIFVAIVILIFVVYQRYKLFTFKQAQKAEPVEDPKEKQTKEEVEGLVDEDIKSVIEIYKNQKSK